MSHILTNYPKTENGGASATGLLTANEFNTLVEYIETLVTQSQLANKQDIIADLETIRSNAQAGKNASNAIPAISTMLTRHTNDNNNPHGVTLNQIPGLSAQLDNKVDKVNGKGLSANDYTTAEKRRLLFQTARLVPVDGQLHLFTEEQITDSDKLRLARFGKWISRVGMDRRFKRGWRIIKDMIGTEDDRRRVNITLSESECPDFGYDYTVMIDGKSTVDEIVRIFAHDESEDYVYFYNGRTNLELMSKSYREEPGYHSKATLKMGIAINNVIKPFAIEISNQELPEDDISDYYRKARFRRI